MLDLQAASLEALEAERVRLDEAIKPLAEERTNVIDEISRRHQSFMRVRDAGKLGPHAVDEMLRSGQNAKAEPPIDQGGEGK